MKHSFKYSLILIVMFFGIAFLGNIKEVNAADYLLQCSYDKQGSKAGPNKFTMQQGKNKKWKLTSGSSSLNKLGIEFKYTGKACPSFIVLEPRKKKMYFLNDASKYKCKSNSGLAADSCPYTTYSKSSDTGRTDESNANDQSGNQKPIEPTEFPEGNCGILGPKTIEIIKELINLVRYLVPLIVIIFGSLDFARILFSGEERVFKEAGAKFLKRIIIGIVFMFIPSIISMIIDLSGLLLDYNIDQVFCGIF